MKALTMLKTRILLALAMIVATSPNSNASYRAERFDPTRHIGIDKIERGMKGFGLTVFHGTKIEKFNLEVISVARNLSTSRAKRNVFFIKCLDDRFLIAKGVQGVSGSPVYINGKLAGAMSFGWSFGEEPLYGVTPIDEMLEVANTATSSASAENAYIRLDQAVYEKLMRDELLTPQQLRRVAIDAGLAKQHSSDSSMTHLPMPLAMTGFSTQALNVLQSHCGTLALTASLPADVANTTTQPRDADNVFKPGATITVPLIFGDMNVSILGTVTEVIGNDIYAFGHGWNSDGPTNWPMASGFVHTFVSRKNMSFKLGQPSQILGTLKADQAAAVFGRVGKTPQMTPMHVRVNWTNAGRVESEDFNVTLARDERADAMLATIVAVNALLKRGNLPKHHTIEYTMNMQFDKAAPLTFRNISSAAGVDDLAGDMIGSLVLLLNNPWQRIQLTEADICFNVLPEDHLAAIRSVQLAQTLYHPGQTVTARVLLDCLRKDTTSIDIALKLPDDLPHGQYKIVVGSAKAFRQQIQNAQPHKYIAYDLEDILKILNERLSLRRDQLYITLIDKRGGLAIETQAMPALPQSTAMMLTDKSRQMAVTRFQHLIADQIPADNIILGQKTITITVRK